MGNQPKTPKPCKSVLLPDRSEQQLQDTEASQITKELQWLPKLVREIAQLSANCADCNRDLPLIHDKWYSRTHGVILCKDCASVHQEVLKSWGGRRNITSRFIDLRENTAQNLLRSLPTFGNNNELNRKLEENKGVWIITPRQCINHQVRVNFIERKYKQLEFLAPTDESQPSKNLRENFQDLLSLRSSDLSFSTDVSGSRKAYSRLSAPNFTVEKDKFGDLNLDWFYLLPEEENEPHLPKNLKSKQRDRLNETAPLSSQRLDSFDQLKLKSRVKGPLERGKLVEYVQKGILRGNDYVIHGPSMHNWAMILDVPILFSSSQRDNTQRKRALDSVQPETNENKGDSGNLEIVIEEDKSTELLGKTKPHFLKGYLWQILEDGRKVRRWLAMKEDSLEVSQLCVSDSPFKCINYSLCGITLSDLGRIGPITEKQDQLKHLQDSEQPKQSVLFFDNFLGKDASHVESKNSDSLESSIALEIYINTKALIFWSPKFNEIREWAEELGKVKTLKTKNINLSPIVVKDHSKYYESNVIGASYAACPVIAKDKSGLLTKCSTFSQKKKWFVLRTGILSIYPKKTMAGLDQPISIINVKNVDISFAGGAQSVIEGREVDDLKFVIKCQTNVGDMNRRGLLNSPGDFSQQKMHTLQASSVKELYSWVDALIAHKHCQF